MWVYAAFIIWVLRNFYKIVSTQLYSKFWKSGHFGRPILSKYPIVDVSLHSFYNMGSTQYIKKLCTVQGYISHLGCFKNLFWTQQEGLVLLYSKKMYFGEPTEF